MAKKIFTLILLLAFLCRGALALTIGPSKIRAAAKERKEATFLLSVSNNGNHEVAVKAKVEEYKLGGKDKSRIPNAARFIKISPLEFRLKKGEVQKVRLSVLAPAESAGEYKSFISFLESGMPKEALSVSSKISVPLELKITP